MQGGERAPLRRVALAHHLSQPHRAELAADRGEPAARLHRGELPRVADRDHLRPRLLGRLEQPRASAGWLPCPPRRESARIRCGSSSPSCVEVEQQPVERPRRHPRLLGQLARRATSRRDAEHLDSPRSHTPAAARPRCRSCRCRRAPRSRSPRPRELDDRAHGHRLLARSADAQPRRSPARRAAASTTPVPSPARPTAAAISRRSHATSSAVVISPRPVAMTSATLGEPRRLARAPPPPGHPALRRRRTPAARHAHRTCCFARSDPSGPAM